MAARAAALELPHAEPALNGRCVGQLEWDDQHGTVLAYVWHDPKGCEHVVPDEAITDRPWRGQCATTGLTMDDFRERLVTVAELPHAVTRAAVSVCRSYGLGRGLSDPGYVANVIAGELARAGFIPCTTDGHEHGRGCQR